jgi:phage terminase small subunit
MAEKNKGEFSFAEAQEMSSADIRKYMDERERRFAEEYLKDFNATQAAIRAGYKAGKNNSSAAVQASRLMRDERVRAYRSALIRESVEDMDISRNTVVLQLTEIFRRCMSAVPVLMWDSDKKEWVNSGEWKFDAKGASKALEQLSKILGFEAPAKHEIRGDSFEEFMKSIIGGRTY